jgi:hypothetical protein
MQLTQGQVRALAALGAVVLVIVVVVLASSGDDDGARPDPRLLGGGSGDLSGGNARRADVGDVITLRSGQRGSRIHVRLVGVVDPVQGGHADVPARRGDHYVGLRLRLSNGGRVPYIDSPSNSSTLMTSGGPDARAVFLEGGPCRGDFPARVRLAPGGKAEGCVPYELAAGSRPQALRFTLEAGYGPATGEWRLAG